MTCPKCGAEMMKPRYHDHWKFCDVEGEHLHYYCVCGYNKTGPTRDANPLSHPNFDKDQK